MAPGLIDMHVHFREPGQAHKETIACRFSRSGGRRIHSSVVCMPNTNPVADNAGTITLIRERRRPRAMRQRLHHGCDHEGHSPERARAPYGSMIAAGIVAITDDGHCVAEPLRSMRRAVGYARMFEPARSGSLPGLFAWSATV